jgi:hypothetical protein
MKKKRAVVGVDAAGRCAHGKKRTLDGINQLRGAREFENAASMSPARFPLAGGDRAPCAGLVVLAHGVR